MNINDKDFDALLDRAAQAARQDSISPADESAARDRVWAKLQAASAQQRPAAPMIEGCEAFQALMPAALAGSLRAGEKVLFDDHLSGCAACRRAYSRAKIGLTVVDGGEKPARTTSATGWRSLAAAAAIVVLVGVGAWVGRDLLKSSPDRAFVTEAPGGMIRLGSDIRPVSQGSSLSYGQTIRTPKDHGALLTLQDGSRIELRERTELALGTRGHDTDIRLTRGNIIVEASKQGSGHLWVTTDDARVAVVGTVFTVTHGLGGSRVSVLEGRVEVDEHSTEHVLLPGDQVSTAVGADRVPLRDEIEWSAHRATHEALLAELQQLAKEIDAIPAKSARTSTRLLDLMPANLAFFGSVPNITDTVGEAHRLFLSHLASSPALAQWWQQHDGGQVGAELDASIARVRAFGDRIGDEIAIGAMLKPDGSFDTLLVLTTLKQPQEFPAFLSQQLSEIEAKLEQQGAAVADGLPVRLVANADMLASLTSASHGDALYLFQQDDLLVASPSPAALLAFTTRSQESTAAVSPLRSALVERYRRGVSWIGGADLAQLLSRVRQHEDTESLQNSGVLDASHLIVESRGKEFEATLAFSGPRHHIAAWLAEPAAMGAIDFVSPNAYFATTAVFKDPASMLADLDSVAHDQAAGATRFFAEFQRAAGVDLRQELFAALGGEMAFAIDGPVVPVPAWKLVLETYDSEALQHAIEALVTNANQQLQQSDRPLRIALSSQVSGGRTIYSLATADGSFGISYTFVDGYWVIASQLPVLQRAIDDRASGLVLVRSGQFESLWPTNARRDVSAFVYSNLGSLMQTMQSAGSAAGLSADAKQTLKTLAGQGVPSLQWATGESQSITMGGTGPSLAGSMLSSFLGANAVTAVTEPEVE
ncbi:MAG: FecR domain-containing protein [Acidobacteriota bacterium]